MGVIFLRIYFQNMFLCYDSKPLTVSHWHGNVGQGNDYFFQSVFRLHIFVEAGEWVHGDGSVGMRMWKFF